MVSIRSSVLTLSLLAAACVFNPPPVPVEGPPGDLERLAGRWAGSYEHGRAGRAGSIEFDLVYGEDHAHGDVIMVPAGSDHSYQSWREGRGVDTTYEPVHALGIRFVAVEGGEITGQLDPYRDPDCDCRAYTRFRGRFIGDAIEGTFVTYAAGTEGGVQGTWRVTRRKP